MDITIVLLAYDLSFLRKLAKVDLYLQKNIIGGELQILLQIRLVVVIGGRFTSLMNVRLRQER
jgi:hypothetical protein